MCTLRTGVHPMAGLPDPVVYEARGVMRCENHYCKPVNKSQL